MADQLCTTAQVKARLGITDATDDTLLSELIDQVSDWIQDYTGRKLVPDNAATYTFDTRQGNVLDIPYGIRSITSMGVAASNQPDTGGTYQAVTAGDILLRPLAIDRRQGWPATQVRLKASPIGAYIPLYTAANGATITGNFGFAATPPAIQSIAIDAVVTAYTVRGNGASAVIGADDAPAFSWATYFGPGSPQRGTLNRYRDRSRGIA